MQLIIVCSFVTDTEELAVIGDFSSSSMREVITAVIAAINRHRTVADVCRYGTKALENIASTSGMLRSM